MSKIQKCPNLVRGGGGQHFSKMSETQKCPKCQRGGGVNPNWDIVPNFLVFFSDASPKVFSFERPLHLRVIYVETMKRKILRGLGQKKIMSEKIEGDKRYHDNRYHDKLNMDKC